ncbi:hypothetical protein F4861DRAFT_11624 [Xylaria intraflava]|nr:hypothetical protein F4861DRAFT_11624 [Xylaria intraflava]
MMRPSQTSRAKRKQLAKFDCIDIWRNEVNASRMYCVCSAPTVGTKKAGRRDSAGTVKTPLPLALSMASGSYKRLVKRATFPSDRGDDRTALGSVAPGSNVAGRRNGTTGGCPVCALPTDGVVYMSLGRDGSGLVRAQRPLSAIKVLEEVWRAKERKGRELLFKVSSVFLRPKRHRLSQHSDSTEPTGTSLDGNLPRRLDATEMYQSLRRKARMDDEDDDEDEDADEYEDDDLLRAFSNSDGKKPQISIQEAGSRLYRAKKLLNKPTGSSSPITKIHQ